MTKRELLEIIEDYPDDMEIAISKDNACTEGSILNDVNMMYYIPYNTLSGSFEFPENEEDLSLENQSYQEFENFENNSEKMIVLLPSV